MADDTMERAGAADDQDVRWLDARELRAWRGWIEAAMRITDRLDHDLRADSGLTLDDYDVLVRLSEAPDHRLRMTELADQVVNSPSRLSQRVDRMVDAGLLVRERSTEDRRGWYAVMSEEGFARLAAAAPGHLRSVRSCLIDRIDDDEIEFLGRLMPRLAELPRD